MCKILSENIKIIIIITLLCCVGEISTKVSMLTNQLAPALPHQSSCASSVNTNTSLTFSTSQPWLLTAQLTAQLTELTS